MDKKEAEALAKALSDTLTQLVGGEEEESTENKEGKEGEQQLDLNDHAAVQAELDRLEDENADLRHLQGYMLPEGKSVDDALSNMFTKRDGTRMIDPDFGATLNVNATSEEGDEGDKVIGGEKKEEHRTTVSVGNRNPSRQSSRQRRTREPEKVGVGDKSALELAENPELLASLEKEAKS